MGVCLGDALGKAFETMNWQNPALLNWDGHSFLPSEFHKLAANQYTDDSHMSIALAKSLISQKTFNPADVANNYLKWYIGPNFVGAGQTTKRALERLKNGATWYDSGELGALGNGSSMRCSPLSIWFKNDISKLIKAAKLDAIITHDSHEAIQGSIAVSVAVWLLLNGSTKEDLLKELKQFLEPSRVLDNINLISSNKLIADTLKKKDYDRTLDRKGGNRIISQLFLGAGYTCIEVVAAALYVFLATNSVEEALELAIRSGADTDTRASIVGAFCGAYYDELPKSYVDQIENKDYILELDKKLYSL